MGEARVFLPKHLGLVVGEFTRLQATLDANPAGKAFMLDRETVLALMDERSEAENEIGKLRDALTMIASPSSLEGRGDPAVLRECARAELIASGWRWGLEPE